MTTALIRFAPLVTLKRINDPTWWQPDRTKYRSGSLELPTGTTEVPLLVDHEDERQVGVVHELLEMNCDDGPWYCARATITDPPPWLRQHTTKASFSRRNLESTWAGPCESVEHAHVTEVSILSPTVKPAEPLAEVLTVHRTERPKPAPPQTDLDQHLIRRLQWKETRARLTALGIDVTNYREPLPLHRSEMESTSVKPGEVIYGDRTIVRRNIGQVLGVR